MDRDISKQIITSRKRKRAIRIALFFAVTVSAAISINSWMSYAISEKELSIGEVDRGVIEITVNAGGKLAPLSEEIIVSPISSRILEVYKNTGDHVEAGEPLLRLELASVEAEYLQKLDEKAMKQSKLVQVRINLENSLSELEMQQQIKTMQLDKLYADFRDERYLDSLGASTPDKVRRAELIYEEAKLQLSQLNHKMANERKHVEAELRVQELELAIFEKSLEESARLLHDARIPASRSATLTFINNQVGSQVSQGTQVAILADLTRFKVEAEAADGYAYRIRVGAKAMVEAGSIRLSGTVVNISPMASNGLVNFVVVPDEASHPGLRSGLRVYVFVQYGVHDNALRLPYGPIFKDGTGNYDVWVIEGDKATKRKITVGEMSYRYVEVRSGLKPGERVILSDMSAYRNKESVKLKK